MRKISVAALALLAFGLTACESTDSNGGALPAVTHPAPPLPTSSPTLPGHWHVIPCPWDHKHHVPPMACIRRS